jgi:hypothetical protein
MSNPNLRVLFIQPLPLDLHRDGNEWGSHLQVALAARGVQEVITKVYESPAKVEFRASSLGTCLWIVTVNEQPHAVVTGSQDTPEEVALWREALDEALARTGQTLQQFHWRAALGPHRSIESRPFVLSRSVQIGSITLYPAVTTLWNAHWIPILAEGATSGFGWEAASVTASAELRRVAALLSVHSNRAITERYRPTPAAEEIPFSQGRPNENLLSIDPPGWLDRAWQLTAARSQLNDALLVHHEGALLSREHPSFAFIAFTASIEAIGTMFKPLDEPCPQCRRKEGARRAFREGVSRVIEDPGRIAKFMKAYDERRSPTAHSGRLHGHEHSAGSYDFTALFTLPPAMDFDWSVFDIQRVSASLLAGIFAGDIQLE